jgi:hypothetical protein
VNRSRLEVAKGAAQSRLSPQQPSAGRSEPQPSAPLEVPVVALDPLAFELLSSVPAPEKASSAPATSSAKPRTRREIVPVVQPSKPQANAGGIIAGGAVLASGAFLALAALRGRA